jgi:hypothetical protein
MLWSSCSATLVAPLEVHGPRPLCRSCRALAGCMGNGAISLKLPKPSGHGSAWRFDHSRLCCIPHCKNTRATLRHELHAWPQDDWTRNHVNARCPECLIQAPRPHVGLQPSLRKRSELPISSSSGYRPKLLWKVSMAIFKMMSISKTR